MPRQCFPPGGPPSQLQGAGLEAGRGPRQLHCTRTQWVCSQVGHKCIRVCTCALCAQVGVAAACAVVAASAYAWLWAQNYNLAAALLVNWARQRLSFAKLGVLVALAACSSVWMYWCAGCAWVCVPELRRCWWSGRGSGCRLQSWVSWWRWRRAAPSGCTGALGVPGCVPERGCCTAGEWRLPH